MRVLLWININFQRLYNNELCSLIIHVFQFSETHRPVMTLYLDSFNQGLCLSPYLNGVYTQCVCIKGTPAQLLLLIYLSLLQHCLPKYLGILKKWIYLLFVLFSGLFIYIMLLITYALLITVFICYQIYCKKVIVSVLSFANFMFYVLLLCWPSSSLKGIFTSVTHSIKLQ